MTFEKTKATYFFEILLYLIVKNTKWEISFQRFIKIENYTACHCCPHTETSQLICCANHLTGFYKRAILAINGLNDVTIHIFIDESSFGKCLPHNIDIKTLILELPTKLFATYYHQKLTYYGRIMLAILSQFQRII